MVSIGVNGGAEHDGEVENENNELSKGRKVEIFAKIIALGLLGAPKAPPCRLEVVWTPVGAEGAHIWRPHYGPECIMSKMYKKLNIG